jgi:mannose PTS system EIID component
MTPDRIKSGADSNAKPAKLSGSLRLTIYLRSLSLQASWNGQRMQNLGLLAVMMPWLRAQPRDLTADRLFCRRYYEFFNTNPYLSNFLIGGLVRLEEDRSRGQSIEAGHSGMFRDSLGRAFASLGDQLFWMGVQPALIMGICCFGLAGLTGPIVAGIGVFALFQLGLRWNALGRGYDMGIDIVDLLGHPHWHQAIRVARIAGAITTGLLCGWYLATFSGLDLTGGRALPGIGLSLGWVLPALLRKRLPGEGLLALAAILVLVLAFAI